MAELKSLQNPNKQFEVIIATNGDLTQIKVKRGASAYSLKENGKVDYSLVDPGKEVPNFLVIPTFLWEAIREMTIPVCELKEVKTPQDIPDGYLVKSLQSTIDNQFVIINKLLDDTGKKGQEHAPTNTKIRRSKGKPNGDRNRPSKSN